MIYLRRENAIILTPHKCGSTTLNYIFTERSNSNGVVIHGPQLGILAHIEKHTNILPSAIQQQMAETNKLIARNREHYEKIGLAVPDPDDKLVDLFTIAIGVRNPYTRALSIYNHHLRLDPPEEDITCFRDFVKYRLVVGGHYFSQTLYAFCRHISTPLPAHRAKRAWPTHMIHLENFQEDIEALGYEFNEIPTMNPTPDKIVRRDRNGVPQYTVEPATLNDYTPEIIDLVRGWGEMDFSCFGYYHDFDKCHLVKEKTKPRYVRPCDEFLGSFNSFSYYLQSGRNTFGEMRESIHNICEIDIETYEKVLDFGCRTGRVTNNFDSNKEIWGVDVRKDIIEWCQENHPLYNFWCNESDEFKLPFEDDFFDFVCSISVFAHIEHLEEWLLEVTRVLKKGGVFYVTINDECAVNCMLEINEKNPIEYIDNLKKAHDFDGFLGGFYPVIWDGYFSFCAREHFLNLMPSYMKIEGLSKSESFQTAYVFKKR
tara:strand:- start:11443 stop:12897 length:1455 start_codon:yes stop_codon:yes gene_type:complete